MHFSMLIFSNVNIRKMGKCAYLEMCLYVVTFGDTHE